MQISFFTHYVFVGLGRVYEALKNMFSVGYDMQEVIGYWWVRVGCTVVILHP